MTNAVQTLSDVIRKGAMKLSGQSPSTVMPNYIKLIDRKDVTEEEMKREASAYADSLYGEKISKVSTDAEKKLIDLNARLDKAIDNNESQQKKVSEAYNKALEQNINNAVKQGIVNSSIFEGMTEKSKEDYLTKQKELNDALDSTASSIMRETDLIIEARDIALSNYEIKRAAEYEKKLQELREVEYAAREEVRKKNEQLQIFIDNYEKYAKRAQSEWADAREKGQI